MECTNSGNFDSYTRYRTAAVAAVRGAQERAALESVALALALSAFWGYVFYIVLRAIA
jgi:hypothetical protein